MTKKVVYYCDNCKKEIDYYKWWIKMEPDVASLRLYRFKMEHLCEECAGKYYRRLQNE